MAQFGPLIGADELGARIAKSGLRVLDCRFSLQEPAAGRAAYEAAHIPVAVYADLDKDLAAAARPGSGRHPLPRPDELAMTFGGMGIDADMHVVVYDDSSGALAARAWWLLRWLGHAKVSLLDGGFSAWQRFQGPVETGAVRVTARNFAAAPRDGMLLETKEIVTGLGSPGDLLLVDARDPARFCGVSEPIDRVAGHIPGAINLPYSENLEASGQWKEPAELRRIWRRVLGSDPSAPWGVMCGSGVTACHHVVSALVAGLREPRLYVGSWSEWIADPERPVATGMA
jgi:thiosulfate/3-mercaptopyruvate sulfurtransferase